LPVGYDGIVNPDQQMLSKWIRGGKVIMELFGIVFSLPASFVATSIYTIILKQVLRHWTRLSKPIQWTSYLIVILVFFEVFGVAVLGTLKLRSVIGAPYYPLHLFLFVLGVPALANLLQLQKRIPVLSKWYLTAMICMVYAFGLVFLQYAVTDDLFGIDGQGGPYQQTYPF